MLIEIWLSSWMFMWASYQLFTSVSNLMCEMKLARFTYSIVFIEFVIDLFGL